jgi:TolB-like protein
MTKTSQPILLGLALVIFSSCWSCARQASEHVYVKNGKEYGKIQGAFFRHRWWNYYERGLSYAEGEFYREALADLSEALSQREKDQRMARTYGMHFIDYFPHRELGVIHYQMGNFEEARNELEISLGQFPTAKARFYLDRARKVLIEREADQVMPPKLTLDFSTDEVWTREDPVVLTGVAEDDTYVAGITIAGVPLFLDGSEKRVSFEQDLVLDQGRHHIQVEAKNLLGKVATRRVVVHVDREGPMIILDELLLDRVPSGQEVTIRGSIYDEAGVHDLTLNGQNVPIRQSLEVHFTHKLVTHKDVLEMVARDRLGNPTSADIPLSPNSASIAPVRLAYADSEGDPHFIVALFGPKDKRPPRIKLKGWTDVQTVFLDKVYLEGQAGDESRITGLSINQVPVLRREGRIIFFSHTAELREGENVITVEAVDEAGNKAAQTILVIRRVPKALQLAERLSLTVVPFEQKGEVSAVSLAFLDNLIDALVSQNRFRVVERDKLDVILAEQKLSRSQLIDKKTALEVGKLVAAQYVISGTIVETRAGIEIVSRMIDTETSEIMAVADVYDEVKELPALMSLAEGMAIKFHRDFPLVDGQIIQKKSENIFTDLGQEEVKLKRRLIVYREIPLTHPVTGKMLGADNEIICRARITQVMPEISKAQLVDGHAKTIKIMDKVITE